MVEADDATPVRTREHFYLDAACVPARRPFAAAAAEAGGAVLQEAGGAVLQEALSMQRAALQGGGAGLAGSTQRAVLLGSVTELEAQLAAVRVRARHQERHRLGRVGSHGRWKRPCYYWAA